MRIHFDMSRVKELLAHARAAKKHRQTYGNRGQGPGLMLVGDEGVYFMSNGLPPLLVEPPPVPGTKKHVSVECRETACHSDPGDRHRAKTDIFGGDDGVEYISARDVETAIATYPADAGFLILEINESGFGPLLFKSA